MNKYQDKWLGIIYFILIVLIVIIIGIGLNIDLISKRITALEHAQEQPTPKEVFTTINIPESNTSIIKFRGDKCRMTQYIDNWTTYECDFKWCYCCCCCDCDCC